MIEYISHFIWFTCTLYIYTQLQYLQILSGLTLEWSIWWKLAHCQGYDIEYALHSTFLQFSHSLMNIVVAWLLSCLKFLCIMLSWRQVESFFRKQKYLPSIEIDKIDSLRLEECYGYVLVSDDDTLPRGVLIIIIPAPVLTPRTGLWRLIPCCQPAQMTPWLISLPAVQSKNTNKYSLRREIQINLALFLVCFTLYSSVCVKQMLSVGTCSSLQKWVPNSADAFWI